MYTYMYVIVRIYDMFDKPLCMFHTNPYIPALFWDNVAIANIF